MYRGPEEGLGAEMIEVLRRNSRDNGPSQDTQRHRGDLRTMDDTEA